MARQQGLKGTFSLRFFSQFSYSLGPPFWNAHLMFCIIWFLERKSSSSKRRFHVSCEDDTEMRSPFHLDTITLEFFVICYYLLTEDCRKTQNFKYQSLVFSFLTYVIIFLFRPMYLVIKCSFMNKSYIAKIFINIYIAYCIYRHTAHIGYSIQYIQTHIYVCLYTYSYIKRCCYHHHFV